ncbi:aa3-type cytochrome oxidase subunit II [Catellatospora vulcania]|uniref:aa3-type cytochrome oxidase subunit II n=1 Tax=Catellatospora vulcania TaxID=1460450 RepID=UPI0012D391A0|nr:cytochrome c oxidase subunit II [Catellatospora vulcania]
MSVVLVTLLAGCSINNIGAAFDGFGWPEGGITEQSERMYDLWVGSVVAALAVGVFVWGLIFWCVAAYRRKRGDADLPTQTRFNLPIEILYTVLPFLVIAVLFYYTAVVQTDVNKLTKNPDATVEVVAFKWNWQFNYLSGPGVDAAKVESTPGDSNYIPVVVIPTGKTVRFIEHSNDVIHSFWVPELLFKRDVFPGNVINQFEVNVIETGSYVGRCAELCGTYHSMMNFELRAVTPEKYDQFVAALKSGKSTPEALTAIGENPYATTTTPFPTLRTAN